MRRSQCLHAWVHQYESWDVRCARGVRGKVLVHSNVSWIHRNTPLTAVNHDPPADHDRCTLIWDVGGAMDIVRRSITSFQEVAVWPLNVIIDEEVSHKTLELIDRKEPTRAIKKSVHQSIGVHHEGGMERTTHAFHDQREGAAGWSRSSGS
jgi:hypothetical protein